MSNVSGLERKTKSINADRPKNYRWVSWAFFVFLYVGVLVVDIEFNLDPWDRYLYAVVPILFAPLCTNVILRKLGLSQEAEHIEILKFSHPVSQSLPNNFRLELSRPHWVQSIYPLLALAVVVALLSVYFFVISDSQQDRERGPYIIYSVIGISLFIRFCFSGTIIYADKKGIWDLPNPVVPWKEIVECQIHERRDTVGNYSYTLILVGENEKELLCADLRGATTEDRNRFYDSLRAISRQE